MTRNDAPPTPEPLTMRLAEWVASPRGGGLPDEVGHQVRRSLVDYLAATILGSEADSATIVRDYLADTDTGTTSTVVGTGVRLSPAGAATANGIAAHAWDVDDGYTPGGGHPGASVISAALAAAEANGNSATDLERAIAVGYEVACRIGESTHPAQRERGFHNTALFGVFGATTAVACLHDLDATTLANAYGLAGSHAAGLLSFLDQGSHVKRFHGGKAARDGLVCAELAARGLTGPTTVLEGAHGYFNAFTGGDHDVDALMGGLGTEWRMLRTYQKPCPCCRHVHSAIDAALVIRERESLDPTTIESIRVDTFAIAASHDSQDIGDLLDAQMSLPYSVGAALVHGEVGMSQFEDESRNDPVLAGLVTRFQVFADAAYTAAYPKARGARVAIRAGGAEYVEEVMQPYGEPDNPMSDDAIDAKFRRLVGPILGAGHTDALAVAAWSLDDAHTLFGLLGRR